MNVFLQRARLALGGPEPDNKIVLPSRELVTYATAEALVGIGEILECILIEMQQATIDRRAGT